MRPAVWLVVLAALGCSYDWQSLEGDGAVRPDPRHEILAPFTCNPVSGDGCSDPSACLGEVAVDQRFRSLGCSSPRGSGGVGSYCADESFCLPPTVCWADPADGTHTTCEQPCFDDSDCSSGHCDTADAYAVVYGTAVMHRCR